RSLGGRSLPGELKEVAIEDLLGRKPVTPDWKAIRGWLGGRSVLVTGAGGSIGGELCRQCAKHGAGLIALVEIDELALIKAESELRRDFPQIRCIPVLRSEERRVGKAGSARGRAQQQRGRRTDTGRRSA